MQLLQQYIQARAVRTGEGKNMIWCMLSEGVIDGGVHGRPVMEAFY
jgi:hypothetical protein